MRVYNVCNDYSIIDSSLREKPSGYEWRQQVGFCTDETHKGQEVTIEYGYCQSTCRRLKTKPALLENRAYFLLTLTENKNPAVLTFIENETTIIENKPKTAGSAHNH